MKISPLLAASVALASIPTGPQSASKILNSIIPVGPSGHNPAPHGDGEFTDSKGRKYVKKNGTIKRLTK